MKKHFLNLGKALSKAEQKLISGGRQDSTLAGDGWCSDQCGTSMGHDWGCSASDCKTRYCGGESGWHYCA